MNVERVWIYEAVIVRHVDGDTTVMDIDMGMNIWNRNQYVRWAGINAPEMSTQEGKDAKAFVEAQLPLGTKVYLATLEYHEFEKYGRVLAVIYVQPPESFDWAQADLADLMPGSMNQFEIDNGHAVAYNPSGL